MPTRRKANCDSQPSPASRRPATTPQAREQQLIALAYDVAERKMRDGTASAQEITHFLKMGSSREFLDQEKIRHENSLLQTKKEAMDSAKRVEDLYAKALNAMRSYAGQDPFAEEEDQR